MKLKQSHRMVLIRLLEGAELVRYTELPNSLVVLSGAEERPRRKTVAELFDAGYLVWKGRRAEFTVEGRRMAEAAVDTRSKFAEKVVEALAKRTVMPRHEVLALIRAEGRDIDFAERLVRSMVTFGLVERYLDCYLGKPGLKREVVLAPLAEQAYAEIKAGEGHYGLRRLAEKLGVSVRVTEAILAQLGASGRLVRSGKRWVLPSV